MADDASTTTPQEGGDSTFTQADVDRIVKDRLNRQAAQLKANQPDDDELKKLRDAEARLQAIENASKDDLEKATEQIADLQGKLAQKDSEIASLTTKVRDTTVKQAVISEAAKAQFGEEKTDTFVDPEDAYRFLDADKIEYDEDGNATNIADLVGGIATDKSHLLGARRTQGPDMDLGPRTTTTDNPEMSPAQEHGQWLAKHVL